MEGRRRRSFGKKKSASRSGVGTEFTRRVEAIFDAPSANPAAEAARAMHRKLRMFV